LEPIEFIFKIKQLEGSHPSSHVVVGMALGSSSICDDVHEVLGQDDESFGFRKGPREVAWWMDDYGATVSTTQKQHWAPLKVAFFKPSVDQKSWYNESVPGGYIFGNDNANCKGLTFGWAPAYACEGLILKSRCVASGADRWYTDGAEW